MMNLSMMLRPAIAGAFMMTAAAAQAGENGESPFGALVPGEGAEETYVHCAACHSEMLVAQQGLTRERWADLIEWMVDEQGMNPIEEPDYTLVLDYLAEHYNTDRPNFPRN
ncbi:aldehyde dehydrogenase [Oceaniradius stylonematis]|jgi:cytochrome c|uniref:Aldehyde dehydrogenase n=2 Tax=Oceaniradius stylonematis TaxID=2184161 RepID=A0A3A8AMW6_9HYPH|nr:aldehyde dehydrogenase [Oceaniradius stylonematis]RNC96576.1 MAG: aldehyde dehydrogenase [Oricola sp.]